mmetsp:Transcript_17601/g.42129  ORF Transcript_17601/g.42129 Transcript_17601/m.42129 type:complete len:262 (-) Transcript_17601:65-850(-)
MILTRCFPAPSETATPTSRGSPSMTTEDCTSAVSSGEESSSSVSSWFTMSMMRRTMLPLRTTQRGAALWASFGNCRLKTFAWSIGSGSASSDGAPLWNTFPVRVCTTTACRLSLSGASHSLALGRKLEPTTPTNMSCPSSTCSITDVTPCRSHLSSSAWPHPASASRETLVPPSCRQTESPSVALLHSGSDGSTTARLTRDTCSRRMLNARVSESHRSTAGFAFSCWASSSPRGGKRDGAGSETRPGAVVIWGSRRGEGRE